MKTLEAVAAVSQELKLRCQARVGTAGVHRCRKVLRAVTEGPLGFCRRICPGRRERSPRMACLSSTGSASPTPGQGEFWVQPEGRGAMLQRRGVWPALRAVEALASPGCHGGLPPISRHLDSTYSLP